MLEIYIVRHGKTLFNQKDMVQGACDSPLTQEGVMQAKNVGKNMLNIPFTIALSSPSGRASDTCEYVINNRLPIIYDKRLKEMDFGHLEGEKNAALREGKPKDFNEMCAVGWVEEGGENTQMVMDRIASFFDDLVKKYDNEVILIATHGMWIYFAMQYLFNKDIFPQNCSVSKIIYTNKKFIAEDIDNLKYRED